MSFAVSRFTHSRAQAIAIQHPADALQRAIDLSWYVVLGISCFLIIQFLSEPAHAAGTMEGVICGVAIGLSGKTGTAIATIAVAALGIGALFGKTSWTLALTTTVGISIVIGANDILKLLFPGANRTFCSGASANITFTELDNALCIIAKYMTGTQGTIAKALATCGVFILAFSAFFGRISWGPAVALGVAVGIIFGAGSIVRNVFDRNACGISSTVTIPPTATSGGSSPTTGGSPPSTATPAAIASCVATGGTWVNDYCNYP